MRTLYTWLFRAAIPLALLRLWWRGRDNPAYRERWRERFGRVPARGRPSYRRRWYERFGVVPVRQSKAPLLWIHSVSVGETLAAVPLIKELVARHGDWQWLVTTTTPTGSQQVHDALEPLLGARLLHYYLPFDLPECFRPFLNALRPNALVSIETELWPNMLASCAERGIPALVANARMSEKSAKGYARFPGFSRAMLGNLSRVVAQYPADAERFMALGVPPERIKVTGNIKFDLHIVSGLISEAQALAHQWRGAGGRPIWLAASTHAGEDEIILDAFEILRREFPQLLLVLVPRHPERFDGVARLCRERGFRLLRRSDGGPPSQDCQILLGDTMGELLKFYGACDLAFVGGSLVPVGGHNMIEPAAWGVPVVCGPHLRNFLTVSELLRNAGALKVAEDAEQLARHSAIWLRDESARYAAGERGREVAEQNSGALACLVGEIESLMRGAANP